MGKLIDPRCYMVVAKLPYQRQVEDRDFGRPYYTSFSAVSKAWQCGDNRYPEDYLMTKDEAKEAVAARKDAYPTYEYTILKVQEVS